MAGGRQLFVHDALGHDATAVAAVGLGEERAGQPRLADRLEVALRQLAQETAALGAGLVLGLDLLHPAVRLRRRGQDLLLGEGARLVHEALLLLRVEVHLAALHRPAARHGHILKRDGAEELGVHGHELTSSLGGPKTPDARSALIRSGV